MFPCAAASGGVQPAWPGATGMAVGTIAVAADDCAQNRASLRSDCLCEIIWDSSWLHLYIFSFAFCSEYFGGGEGQINPLFVQMLCVSHRSESKRLIFMLCHALGVLTWCECVQS